MNLSVFAVLFSKKPFEEMLDYVQAAGLQVIEIRTGGKPGDAHCNIDELLASGDKRKEYLGKLQSCDLTISAFSCHYKMV
ncbi:hypothetical protein GGGNBK_13185 [Sporosarcina sp. ANT_H38]